MGYYKFCKGAYSSFDVGWFKLQRGCIYYQCPNEHGKIEELINPEASSPRKKGLRHTKGIYRCCLSKLCGVIEKEIYMFIFQCSCILAEIILVLFFRLFIFFWGISQVGGFQSWVYISVLKCFVLMFLPLILFRKIGFVGEASYVVFVCIYVRT